MVKREFQAVIVDNFRQEWLKIVAIDEAVSIEDARFSYDGTKLGELSKRISGKQVTMLEMEYLQGENDFFEKDDNNFVMHCELWTEI